jgi:addiction module HigA family antidote
MSKQTDTFDPDYAVPPGATLLETIEHLGLTQKELAQRMGRPLKTINEIIKGVTAITAETALQLEKVTGVPASFWNNAESNYRERLARLKEQKALKAQTDWLKHFSYTKLVNMRFVTHASTKEEKVTKLLHFFGVASPNQWKLTYTQLEGAAREAKKLKSDLGDLSVWLRAGEILAQRQVCAEYSAPKFREVLKKIRSLTRENPASIWPQVVQLCASAGVALVLVPELPKTHVYGFTRWLTPNKALVQLSLRYKTDDMLWFTLFHEAAHIILHGKKDVFIEFRGKSSEKEKEADAWAAEFLIPGRVWQGFLDSNPQPLTQTDIQKFAREQNVADGIVLGRLQHQAKRVSAGRLNNLKHRLEINWSGVAV